MDYRRDIQILRAIAVVMVVLFHLGAEGFANGFLGVDIFFVVSGYLMFKLFRPEDGALNFYLRRARRLLPIYYIIVLTTLIASAFRTLPIDFVQVANQTKFSIVFASNVGFWMQNSYFSKGEFNPLLHLWSLGVEIQFYLLVPFIFLFCKRWPILLIAMVVASLAMCVALVTVSPKTAFFLLPTRLWEFGIGMLVARTAQMKTAPDWTGWVGWIGIALVLFLPVEGELVDPLRGHPAMSALWTSIATALVLIFRTDDAVFDNKIGKGAVFVGTLSYAIYLVHFPIIILWFYQPFGGTRLGTGQISDLWLLPIIFVVALIAHVAVEKPGGRWLTTASALAVTAMLTAGSVLLPIWQLQRFEWADRAIFAAWSDRAPYRCGILVRLMNPLATTCLLNAPDAGDETVLLVGDSHADAIKTAFSKAAARSGVAVRFVVANDPLLSTGRNTSWLIDEARRHGVRRIFLHYARHNTSVSTIEQVRVATAIVGLSTTLILPVPESDRHVPQALYRARRGEQALAAPTMLGYNSDNRVLLDYLATRPHLLGVVPVAPILCSRDCPLQDKNGQPYYFDASHLTLTGASRLETIFANALTRSTPVQGAQMDIKP